MKILQHQIAVPTTNEFHNQVITTAEKQCHGTTCTKRAWCVLAWVYSSFVLEEGSMMTKDLGNYQGFDRHVDVLGVVIGCQFYLTVVRFIMLSPFRTVKHKLSDSCFDWVAKLVTTGSVSNDITVVVILLFGKAIRSLCCRTKFQIRTGCMIETPCSNIDHNILKCKCLIVRSSTGVFARAHTIKEGNTDHVSHRLSFIEGERTIACTRVAMMIEIGIGLTWREGLSRFFQDCFCRANQKSSWPYLVKWGSSAPMLENLWPTEVR